MKQIIFYMMMTLIMLFLVMISVLIGVAFLTLMERKFLGYIQIRKGPNKLGFMGLIQPFSDAIKLISKESNLMNKMNFIYYIFSPVFSLILILMMWMMYMYWTNYLIMKLGLLYLMCCFSISVYGMLLAGWSSNSSYSLIGSIRALAQSISYEVSLSIILIIPFFFMNSMNLNNFYYLQLMGIWMFIYLWPLSLLLLFSFMAELNRTPFDFSEGESELVSGFNVEYSSVGFILIFLSEYASILFLSFLYNLIYLGGDYYSIYFYFKILMMSILIVWIRGTLPRFRYDLLMNFCWLVILPLSLHYLFYNLMFKIFLWK